MVKEKGFGARKKKENVGGREDTEQEGKRTVGLFHPSKKLSWSSMTILGMWTGVKRESDW